MPLTLAEDPAAPACAPMIAPVAVSGLKVGTNGVLVGMIGVLVGTMVLVGMMVGTTWAAAPEDVTTVPPARIERLPNPASPTTNRPVFDSSDRVPVTVAEPVAPADCPTSNPWNGSDTLLPLITVPWF